MALFLEYPYYGYRKVLAMSECKHYVPIMPEMKLVCSLSATVIVFDRGTANPGGFDGGLQRVRVRVYVL